MTQLIPSNLLQELNSCKMIVMAEQAPQSDRFYKVVFNYEQWRKIKESIPKVLGADEKGNFKMTLDDVQEFV